jgi:hypothetical protein
MTIREFAEQYRCRLKRDGCGEQIIPGKVGQIYDYGSGRFGALFMPSGKPRPNLWGRVRRKLMAAGFQLLQNGDAEGCLLFDPSDQRKIQLALKLVGARRKRVLTPERRAAQIEVLERSRNARKGIISPQPLYRRPLYGLEPFDPANGYLGMENPEAHKGGPSRGFLVGGGNGN